MNVAVAITEMIDDQMPGIGSKRVATGVCSLDASCNPEPCGVC